MYLVILGIYVVQNNIQSNLSYVVCPREQRKIEKKQGQIIGPHKISFLINRGSC